MPRREDAESGDKPQTPASEPAQSQPASPQKKKRKVSRSHSIPAHMQTPNVTMGMAEYGSPFGPRGNGMVPPGHHGSPFDGDPHGHPQWGHPMHPHMHPHPGHSPMHPSAPHMHPMQPMSPGAHPAGYPGQPGHHTSFMRPPMSLPQHIPSSSMHGPGPGMPGPMSSGPGCIPGEPMQTNGPPMSGPPSSGPYNSSSGCVYPSNQPMIFNQNNPNAPPIYPCGSCHKEVNDSDQAMLCESGCNFWFHRQCTGLTEPAYTFLTKEIYAEWVCDPCLVKKNIPLIKFKP